jgi:tetratricopeptide (TPR) repeat protein
MQIFGLLIGASLLLVTAPTVLTANQRDWDDCKANDPERSIAGCTRILERKDESTHNLSVAYNDRGLAFRRRGDPDRSIADFGEAMRLGPKDATHFYNRGLAYGDKKELDRAIADHTEAIRLGPDRNAIDARSGATLSDDRAYADYFYGRGVAYQGKGDLDRAIADFTAAIRLQPRFAIAYASRGSAYEANGECGRAAADYSEAIRLGTKDD